MDNLYSTYSAVEGLISFANQANFGELEGNINAIALFNHEEVRFMLDITETELISPK